ncbi:cystathionine gamma-synthase [Candidatus Gottesmanbacteria bacterium RIFCSPHIGHO2_02_FULL_39_11]|uniref:Cystathionine gamma-synthase n=1 Tax=Candidatus Gottesmanbacteria bacterium RIFCSPHIGHO2_02_FULL_39_11 TaxID=1798382 RepID=A0A1F5ZX20_9BACT|nr:MAG: cystathionine gamma-synthase [Candidatus Gottesmanbacteria bacterium RIFCSPHIGHO2_02_FULL_39_11]
MKFSTNAVHAGNEPNLKDGGFGDVIVPIHLSTTFARSKVDKPTAGLEYSRSGNPTRGALEKNLANLEHAKFAYAFSSGLAAITNILLSLKKGDHVISIDDVYGGTRRLFTRVFQDFGLEFTFADFATGKDIEKYIRKNTKMVWVESPTNPLMKIIDIASVSTAAKKYNLLTVVDNTFASPYFQKPLDLGADIVIHSMTKYIGGHSTSVAGAIMINNASLAEKIKFLQNAVGAILSPFDSFMILNGIKTLSLRMEKHQENAFKVIEFLQKNSKVRKIYFPGLPSHKGYDIAKKQMSGFSGMLSFELNTNLKSSVRFLESLKLISVAESLGVVESLIEHPASMTHASVPPEERKKIGLSDGLIRLSVGIEDTEDLIDDLSQALKKI